MRIRFHLLLLSLLMSMGKAQAAQYSETASTTVYEMIGITENMLDVFYLAWQDGRRYPTEGEFASAGISMMDIAFLRSHVRPRSVMVDKSKNVVSGVQDNRKLWMNIPIGTGKVQGGYPSSNFNDDTFTGWNYTNVFGSWNQGVFHCPSVVTDCAHKNGSDIYSGIKFFESWGTTSSGWISMVQKTVTDDSGYKYTYNGTTYNFKYVKPFIHALMYFGQDGLNYNFEDSGYSQKVVIAFHKACYKYASECGFTNFHIGIYTSESVLSSSNVESLLGSTANGKTADTFLNYSSSDFQTSSNISSSVNVAVSKMGSCDGVYQGTWLVSMKRSWSNLGSSTSSSTNKKMGIVLWGEHNQSRLFSWCSGNSCIDFQEKYQKLQERFFSGGYRNPASRPAETNSAEWTTESSSTTGLRNFQGLAEYIPERTAISQNLPFTTFFCTGAGDRYNYKGKKTHGSWYNLGQQDVVPTYRWLVYKKGTATAVTDKSADGSDENTGIPEFTNADAYVGGSCLRLTNTTDVDIVLYRTALTSTTGNPKVTLALKVPHGVDTATGTVSVIMKLKDSSSWIEVPFGNPGCNTWVESMGNASISSGSVIEYVGLRTNGSTAGMLVGELSINDDITATPASITNVDYEVKEETQASLSVKLRWNVDATVEGTTRGNDYNLIYNDEANIDHFEIFYKNGEDGKAFEVARTTSWSAYVGNIQMGSLTKPYIGVRAASTDGKTYSAIVWQKVQRADASLLPETSTSASSYPSITMNDGSEGIDNALAQRYVTSFKTSNADADISYTNTEGTPYQTDNTNKTNYILATDVIKVHQGQTISCSIGYAVQSDGLQWCTLRGYCDWDGDHAFSGDNDEVVLSVGASNAKAKNTALANSNPYSFSITIPDDAATGANRLRLVFSDAWFPHPGSSGTFSKGFAIDFPMTITGTNPPRTTTDAHDQYLSGDVNTDDAVNIADISELVGILIGKSSYSSAFDAPNFKSSDLDADNKLTRDDIRVLKNRLLSIPDDKGKESDAKGSGNE